MSKILVLASTNLHKVREYRSMLKALLNIDLWSLADFPEYRPPEETGATFEENVTLKALHAARELQQFVLADDSGLVVPALGGAPGVHSARYAGRDATDFENRKKLLAAMAHCTDEARHGFYECWIAIASPDGIQKMAKGICEGTLALQEKGSGFGYDPLFLKHGYQKSFGELGDAIKSQVSHRKKALDKLVQWIETL